MKRLHIHVSVDKLADSIGFYSAMFAAAPSVQKDDYAKWMLDDPRVNFAISQRGMTPGLNHLGIQVESAAELDDMQARLETLQPGVQKEADAACCYAKSDKYWVADPQGIAWETFHTLDSIPVFGKDHGPQPGKLACCVPLAKEEAASAASCCAPAASKTAPTSSCC